MGEDKSLKGEGRGGGGGIPYVLSDNVWFVRVSINMVSFLAF